MFGLEVGFRELQVRNGRDAHDSDWAALWREGEEGRGAISCTKLTQVLSLEINETSLQINRAYFQMRPYEGVSIGLASPGM